MSNNKLQSFNIMFVQKFIAQRIKSNSYKILYDKTLRNCVNLQSLENQAYEKLKSEIELNFDVQVPLAAVNRMVKDVLDEARMKNGQDKLSLSQVMQNDKNEPTTSKCVTNEDDIMNNCLLELEKVESLEKQAKTNSTAFFQPYVSHRKTRTTPINKQKKNKCELETFSKNQARQVKDMERKLKKVEKLVDTKFKSICEEQHSFNAFPLIFEKLLNIDATKFDECTEELLAEMQTWFDEA